MPQSSRFRPVPPVSRLRVGDQLGTGVSRPLQITYREPCANSATPTYALRLNLANTQGVKRPTCTKKSHRRLASHICNPQTPLPRNKVCGATPNAFRNA
ncbi:hypothetical protein EGT09_08380 [Pseudomonas putida]|nr:hypothetical protein EGT09_08380 [Pseudomonas putida]